MARERISVSVLSWMLGMAVAISLGMVRLADAGTVLVPAEQLVPETDNEGFPESKFGQPPARIAPGINSTFAAREADRIDEEFRAGPSHAAKNRAPASLEMTEDMRPTRMEPRKHILPEAHDAPVATNPSSLKVSAGRGVQEVSLIAGDLGYFPKTVFVVRDVPVRMFVTGASKNTLCIMMDSFQVRRQVRTQKIEEITFTPNSPGKYRFYCPVNGMEGTLIVKELASADPTE
jgi:plastocyanin